MSEDQHIDDDDNYSQSLLSGGTSMEGSASSAPIAIATHVEPPQQNDQQPQQQAQAQAQYNSSDSKHSEAEISALSAAKAETASTTKPAANMNTAARSSNGGIGEGSEGLQSNSAVTLPKQQAQSEAQAQVESHPVLYANSNSTATAATTVRPFRMHLLSKKTRKRKLGQASLSSSSSSGSSSSDGSEDELEEERIASAKAAAALNLSPHHQAALGRTGLHTTIIQKDYSNSSHETAPSSTSAAPSDKQQQHPQKRANTNQHENPVVNTASAAANSNDSKVSSPSSPPSGDTDTATSSTAAVTTAAPASPPTTATTTANSNEASPASPGTSTAPQPEGWRVKLYRLNADGSWDDCGTGRIVCLYRPPIPGAANNSKAAGVVMATAGNGSGAPADDGDADDSESSDAAAAAAGGANSGTGTSGDSWLYQETGEATLCVHAEVSKQSRQPRVLLRTRILLRDAYQRQGENIITWCEPYYGRGNNNNSNNNDAGGGPLSQHPNQQGSSQQQQGGVDLALSFQDNAGCLDIWRQITHVQGRAADLLRQDTTRSSNNSGNGNSDENASNNDGGNSVQDMAAQVAAQHHADLQRQQQHEFWAHLTEDQQHQQQQQLQDSENGMSFGPGSNSYMEAAQSLPNPPTLQCLEEIADTFAALQHIQQRESLAIWISKDDCAYLKLLLELFPAAEARGDYGKLATLAACVKTVLLLNEPPILELIVTSPNVFEEVCSCLEYDPDLREKANHRWFLRDRAKFRTVVPMEDPELIDAIHRSFRVNYLRDTLLRPTMDESSLSTLSSLQTFTHADVVKGVTVSESSDVSLKDSYLVRVIRMLGVELHAITILEWAELEAQVPEATVKTESFRQDELPTDPSIVMVKNAVTTSATWSQYLAPQDSSLSSRRMRRRGCLSFLKELFNMVRISLQQSDKDDFFSVICSLDVDLNDDNEIADNVSQTSQTVEVGSYAGSVKSERLDEKSETAHFDLPAPISPVNLLSLMGSVLSDPNTDVTEKGSVLEIIAGVAMHNPSLIRLNCLEFNDMWMKEGRSATRRDANEFTGRPDPNEKKQILFLCPRNDLLASLLFLLDVETDAGVLLQVSEIMRIILDADMMGDHGPMNAAFADEAEPPGSVHSPPHDQHNQPSGAGATTTDQKKFLSMFYEHYVEWLVAPFQYSILHPVRRVPDHVLWTPSESPLMQRIMTSFRKGITKEDALFREVPGCAIRSSFAVELLSFCVRAHLYRMKFFLLKSRVLGNVLKLLRPHPNARVISGDRCLKLAALRFLRAILSVNDEFYHRHIIQHNLFAPVFEAFRANPVGDNLVSSAIVEMCDFIHGENIKSLLEYIVTKHLSASNPETEVPSLEDVSSPYVSTLTVLRKAYEANLNATRKAQESENGHSSPGGSRFFPGGHAARVLSGKALEDQRKFREVDNEESYFDSDDDESNIVVPAAIDEVAARQGEREMHRTPRMFSLAQAPLLNHMEEPNDNDDRDVVSMEEGPLDGDAGSEVEKKD
jgi:hypothetical protein